MVKTLQGDDHSQRFTELDLATADICSINKLKNRDRMTVEEIVIVGGGIAGVATALALRRVGKKSLVLERWGELRETGSALTLSHNAWRALDVLGVGHKLKPHYRLLRTGTVTNLATGATQTQSFSYNNDSGGEGMGPRSVHRTALLESMAEELPPDSIRFCSKLVSIKTEVLPDSSTIMVLHLDDGAIIRAKSVIGCDGVHSVVAQWLGLAAPRDSGRSAVRGLAVYPEGHNFRSGLQQFLFNGVRAGFVPINDKDVYWFVTHPTIPMVHEMGRDPELIRRATLEHFVINLPAEFKAFAQQSEASSLSWVPFLYRQPWNVLFGHAQHWCVTVAGDAYHPTTPDLGQGACIALEDAVVLARYLAHVNSREEMAEGMARYVVERRWRAAWLIIASYFSGFVQQGSYGAWSWAVKFFRDLFFYRFVFPHIARIAQFDCGELPKV